VRMRRIDRGAGTISGTSTRYRRIGSVKECAVRRRKRRQAGALQNNHAVLDLLILIGNKVSRLSVAPTSAAISPTVVDRGHVAPAPIVVHVVARSITHSVPARSESVGSTDSRPAPIHAPVAGVVAIHKHTALPILVSTAIIEAAIAKYVNAPALSASSAAALRES